MNGSLLKVFIKKNWVTWAILTGISILYLAIMILTKDLVADMMTELLSPEEAALFDLDVLEYTAASFFTSLAYIFPLAYYNYISHKLVAKSVDTTSMGSLLASGISRQKYITTAGVFLLGSLFAMFALMFGFGAAFMATVESFSVINYLNVVVSVMLVNMALAMISFFMSCKFAGNKNVMGLIVAVPVVFLLLLMLSDIAVLDWLLYVTPFGWNDIVGISQGTFGLWWLVDLGCIAIIALAFYFGNFFFKRKQLSI